MKRLKIILGLLLALSPVSLRASDVQIYPTGPNFALPSLIWGSSTAQGFNNNYFFVPLNTNGSVCIYVENNNPTSAHTFTASIVITPDADNTTPSDGTWQAAAINTSTVAASPSFAAGLGANISSASLVSVNLSASTVQTGSPDTATIHIVQPAQGANCFSGNQSVGSAPNTVSAVPAIQAISDGLSQAFTAFVNQGVQPINTDLLHVNVNNGARTLYFDKVVLNTANAAATIGIIGTSTTGTTCTGGISNNQKIGSPTTSIAIVNSVCTVHPTNASSLYVVSVPANTTYTIDLRGIICSSGTTTGVDAFAFAATTAAVNITFSWYEK